MQKEYFIRLLSLLVLSFITANVKEAFAEPYFCKAPIISTGTHSTTNWVEKKDSPSKDITAYLDPILFNAILKQIVSPVDLHATDFAPLIKGQLLQKAWRKLSKGSRKELLAERDYAQIVSAYRLTELPEKSPFLSAPLSQFKSIASQNGPTLASLLNTKEMLDLFLNLKRNLGRPIAPAMAYICTHAPRLTLGSPSSSDRLKVMRAQINQMDAENFQLLHQLLEEHFRLIAPESIYSQNLGKYLGQVKSLDALLDWSNPSARFSTIADFDQLKINTLVLSKEYQSKVSLAVQTFLAEKTNEVKLYLTHSKDSQQHFESQKKAFMTQISRLPNSLKDDLIASIPPQDEKGYQSFQKENVLKSQVQELENGFLWRQTAKAIGSYDEPTRKLYSSLFYFAENPLLKELGFIKESPSLTSPTDKKRPLPWDFSQASLVDQLFKLAGKEILLFPWYFFNLTQTQSVSTPSQNCKIEKLTDAQVRFRCNPKDGYLGSHEKLVTIVRDHEYVTLALFLDQVMKDETQTSTYFGLFPNSSSPEKAFLKILKSKVNETSPRDQQQTLAEFEGQLTLDQKICLEEVTAIVGLVRTVQNTVDKYVNLADESSGMTQEDQQGKLSIKDLVKHFDNILALLRSELETNVFSRATLSKKSQAELWNESALTFLQNVSGKVRFQAEAESGLLRTTLLDYVRYLILKSLDLHEKTPPTLPKPDSFVVTRDQVAFRLYSMVSRDQKGTPFTKKYVLNSISRFGDFFFLEPKSDDPHVAESLSRLFAQMVELYKYVNQEGIDPTQQAEAAINKLHQLQSEVWELKKRIYENVLAGLKTLPSSKFRSDDTLDYKTVLQRLAYQEIYELFHNSNKLVHLMERVTSAKPLAPAL